jgi:hypothetical protein
VNKPLDSGPACLSCYPLGRLDVNIASVSASGWPSRSHGRLRAVRKRAQAAGLPQRLKRCVAMCCDAQRRVAERCDAPRRIALPAVMSISPTLLIDDPNMVQSRGDFKTALLP